MGLLRRLPLALNTVFGGGAAPVIPPYILDTFTDTDATALESHTMDTGPGWTRISGAIAINGNAATALANSDYVSDCGKTTYKITANFTLAGNSNYARFYWAYNSVTERYGIDISADRGSSNDWFLYKSLATNLAAGQLNFLNNSTHEIEIRVGALGACVVLIDTVQIASFTMDAYTNFTKIGIGFTSPSTVKFLDIKVASF